ncbi:MAG: alcohol dehydrogenase catalytic domain-containing protein, partial [Limisphaerales bacterium]
MHAIVYRGVNDLRLETVPVPEIKSGEILVKVAVCGVCPTDIKKIQHGTVAPPRIFGHETSGTVVRVGARVKNWNVGDRVGLHHHVPCLDCHFCRHRAFAQCETYKRTGITAGFEPAGGGYAQFVRVMEFCLPGVVKIPAKNSFEEGAMLEPVNTVLKGVERLQLLTGDRVLVMGQGPIGLMFTKILRLQKMKVAASDLLPNRLQLARQFGAHRTLDAGSPEFMNAARKFAPRGFDAVVLAVPVNAAVTQALELIRGAGKVLLFAHTKRGDSMPVDLSQVCVDEKDLIGSYSSDFLLQKKVAQL